MTRNELKAAVSGFKKGVDIIDITLKDGHVKRAVVFDGYTETPNLGMGGLLGKTGNLHYKGQNGAWPNEAHVSHGLVALVQRSAPASKG